MDDYKKMYFSLAGKVADVVELLIKAQQEGEEDYLSIKSEDSKADNAGD